MSDSQVLPFRPCVLGVFLNEKGKVLCCERSDEKGAWQFPQGGVEEGESSMQAIIREVSEELGCKPKSFEIIKELEFKIRYVFPEDFKNHFKIARKWCGQEQSWFLLKFSSGHGPDLKKADGEFSDFKWESPEWIMKKIVSFKRDAYKEGLSALKLI